MAKQEISNRRQEQRMLLNNLDLKIRKLGISRSLHQYETCRSIDLSFNGLAFASDTLDIQVPEKVDFMLTIEGQEMKGVGVTCNKRQTTQGNEYGMMFLSVFPEISSIFSADKLSTQELESLAKKQAEQFVYSIINKSTIHDAILLGKQQQLFDACRAYLIRLGEMGVRMVGLDPDKLLLPMQAVKIFKDTERKLLLRWHNPQTAQSEQLLIDIENDQLNSTYIINEQFHFKTAIQVLEFVGQQIEQNIKFI